jgi:hypothetical protein
MAKAKKTVAVAAANEQTATKIPVHTKEPPQVRVNQPEVKQAISAGTEPEPKSDCP